MGQTFQTGYSSTLSQKLNSSDVIMYVATPPTVTAWRIYITDWVQQERVAYTWVSSNTLTWCVRWLSKTTEPAVVWTGLNWSAGTRVVLVAMHDQLLDVERAWARTLAGDYSFTWTNNFTGNNDHSWLETISGANAGIIMTGAKKWLKIPSLTTTERLALTPVNGHFVYDSTIGENYQYIAWAWSAISSWSTQPNASTTVSWKSQEATTSQVWSQTQTWSTWSRLFINPWSTTKTSGWASDENKIPVLWATGKLASGFVDTTTITQTLTDAQLYGTGVDWALSWTQTISPWIKNYSSISIGGGETLTVKWSWACILKCTWNVTIAWTIDARYAVSTGGMFDDKVLLYLHSKYWVGPTGFQTWWLWWTVWYTNWWNGWDSGTWAWTGLWGLAWTTGNPWSDWGDNTTWGWGWAGWGWGSVVAWTSGSNCAWSVWGAGGAWWSSAGWATTWWNWGWGGAWYNTSNGWIGWAGWLWGTWFAWGKWWNWGNSWTAGWNGWAGWAWSYWNTYWNGSTGWDWGNGYTNGGAWWVGWTCIWNWDGWNWGNWGDGRVLGWAGWAGWNWYWATPTGWAWWKWGKGYTWWVWGAWGTAQYGWSGWDWGDSIGASYVLITCWGTLTFTWTINSAGWAGWAWGAAAATTATNKGWNWGNWTDGGDVAIIAKIIASATWTITNTAWAWGAGWASSWAGSTVWTVWVSWTAGKSYIWTVATIF